MSVSVIKNGERVVLAGNGRDGTNGIDGVGIDSIEKIRTTGDVDTYRIELSNNTHFDFDVTNGKDGVNGKDGISIVSFAKDEHDNVVAQMSDGTSSVIGKINVDVSGSFLTAEGLGGLRYYNGKEEYYDEETQSWVETSVTPDNVYVMQLAPREMQSKSVTYDMVLKKNKLKFEEPVDTVVDGQTLVVVEKVVLRRKIGSVPTDESDGELVLEFARKNFGIYADAYFVDNLETVEDTEYFYKFFPISTAGVVSNSSLNELSVTPHTYEQYGFRIDQSESDSASMIEYIESNAGYKSAHMDFSKNKFDYGDWADAWFIKKLRPCMVTSDGDVDYYLNPNDLSKREDGTPSDIANAEYEGNAMIEFPKVYIKTTMQSDDVAEFRISDGKVDDDYKCYAHIDKYGNETDYIYISIYENCVVNNKLRSLSGYKPGAGSTLENLISYARANDSAEKENWFAGTLSDRSLITILLLLIGKSTNSQDIFGAGFTRLNNTSYAGTMNDKGMFWGTSDGLSGVKVFGIENLWGNEVECVAGLIRANTGYNGNMYYKMTHGRQDGSTTEGYNTTGTGYINAGQTAYVNGSMISEMKFVTYGMFALGSKGRQGSSSTYYADMHWSTPGSSTDKKIAMFGGAANSGANAGLFALNFYATTGITHMTCKKVA